MGKVTHIGKDTNIASLYSVKQVLDDVLCDLEKGEQYNKAMISCWTTGMGSTSYNRRWLAYRTSVRKCCCWKWLRDCPLIG